jgi:hypothetical protein
MKNLFLFAIILVLALLSCKQEDTITPADPTRATTPEDAKMKTNTLVPAEKYVLRAFGSNPLTYVNGRLASYEQKYWPSQTFLIKYEYNNTRSSVEGEVKATTYDRAQPDQISNITSYKVDLTTGLCFESTHQDFVVPGYLNPPKNLKPKTWRYIYNAHGQLEKRFNKDNLLEWFKYEYVSDDLRKATTYDALGKKVKEVWFDYSQPAGQQLKKNLYPLYIEAADLPDRFLRVFGKSSDHLLTRVSKKNIPLDPSAPYEHLYTYTYNADGYVTGESKFLPGEASLFEYKRFDY